MDDSGISVSRRMTKEMPKIFTLFVSFLTKIKMFAIVEVRLRVSRQQDASGYDFASEV